MTDHASSAPHIRQNSPLRGKHLLFLGSSITAGAAAQGESFAEALAARTGCIATKEAVSGTTLADLGPDSYVARLKRLDRALRPDLFICQLSTNDASQGLPLGTVSPSPAAQDADTGSVAGAIEFIIDFVRSTWHCPVLFYTSPRFDSPAYGAMVALLRDIADKRHIGVIDLWNDADFNAVTPAQRAAFMADCVHPTARGYREWWAPAMERQIVAFLAQSAPQKAAP